MRGVIVGLFALAAAAAPVEAQGLRSTVLDLFTFGHCGQPLCLDVAGEHGEHFSPGLTQGRNDMIAFLTNAIGASVGNVPVTAASGGAVFTFEEGLPVRTTLSAGPIFGDRAQTIGRGRLYVGANLSGLSYRSLRGVPLDGLIFNFTHQNVGDPAMGDPVWENDVIRVQTNLHVDVTVASLVATYGLLDRVDVGIAVPLVRTAVRGSSEAQIIPFGSPTPHTFNGGLFAISVAEGSATGLGDVALRAKLNLGGAPDRGVAILADVRLPTGNEEELLGSGAISARLLGIASARYGDFSPHVNGGFVYRAGERENNAVLLTLGFDQLLLPGATFALDLVSEWQVGESRLAMPGTVVIQEPYLRTIHPTNIPNRKDNLAYASFGAKVSVGGETNLVLNSLVPLASGGLQPNVAWTLGIERSF